MNSFFLSGKEPVVKGSPRISHVQQSCGRGSKTNANFLGKPHSFDGNKERLINVDQTTCSTEFLFLLFEATVVEGLSRFSPNSKSLICNHRCGFLKISTRFSV